MQEEDYSIRDVQEHSYTGWFWRLRSTLASIWIVIRHRETILIAVEITIRVERTNCAFDSRDWLTTRSTKWLNSGQSLL